MELSFKLHRRLSLLIPVLVLISPFLIAVAMIFFAIVLSFFNSSVSLFLGVLVLPVLFVGFFFSIPGTFITVLLMRFLVKPKAPELRPPKNPFLKEIVLKQPWIRPGSYIDFKSGGDRLGVIRSDSLTRDVYLFGRRKYKEGKTFLHGEYKLTEVIKEKEGVIGYYGWNEVEFRKWLENAPGIGGLLKHAPKGAIPMVTTFYVFDKQKNVKTVVEEPESMVKTINGYYIGKYCFKIKEFSGRELGELVLAEPSKLKFDDGVRAEDLIPYLMIYCHIFLFTN